MLWNLPPPPHPMIVNSLQARPTINKLGKNSEFAKLKLWAPAYHRSFRCTPVSKSCKSPGMHIQLAPMPPRHVRGNACVVWQKL